MKRFLLATIVAWPMLVSAQDFGGFDAALHGSLTATRGGEHQLRGRAFEVRGLATLRALPNAVVKARYVAESPTVEDGPWVETRANRDGAFVLHVAIPEAARGPSRFEVQVGDGRRHRTLLHSVQIAHAFTIELQTDRGLLRTR